jgi:hypothetical protein
VQALHVASVVARQQARCREAAPSTAPRRVLLLQRRQRRVSLRLQRAYRADHALLHCATGHASWLMMMVDEEESFLDNSSLKMQKSPNLRNDTGGCAVKQLRLDAQKIEVAFEPRRVPYEPQPLQEDHHDCYFARSFEHVLPLRDAIQHISDPPGARKAFFG